MPIEACDGRWSDWMHSLTRQEHCVDGQHVARPETANEMRARQNRPTTPGPGTISGA